MRVRKRLHVLTHRTPAEREALLRRIDEIEQALRSFEAIYDDRNEATVTLSEDGEITFQIGMRDPSAEKLP